jgi:multiple sugar transport system permease protein
MRKQAQGYLFILPMLILLTVIIIFPLFFAFRNSFFREQGVNTLFVGLDNYVRLFRDEAFFNALRVSVIYTVVCVTLHFLLAMPLALLINQTKVLRTFLRVAFLTPWMIASSLGAVIWMWLLDPHFGVVNDILLTLKLIPTPLAWLSTPELAFTSITLVELWRGYPYMMLMLLAGLQTVPQEQYEAAAIDGANAWQSFLNVTIPNLRYIIMVATTLDVINLIRRVDIIAVMTRGGPVRATEVLPMMVYNESFGSGRFGYASAIGIMLLLILLVFTSVYIRILGTSNE